MNWVCECGRAEADTLVIFWDDSRLYDRPVGKLIKLLCSGCVEQHVRRTANYWRKDNFQYLPVGLSAQTMDRLVNQILAQVIGEAHGYVPKTDLRRAIRALRKERPGAVDFEKVFAK